MEFCECLDKKIEFSTNDFMDMGCKVTVDYFEREFIKFHDFPSSSGCGQDNCMFNNSFSFPLPFYRQIFIKYPISGLIHENEPEIIKFSSKPTINNPHAGIYEYSFELE